MTLYVMVGGKKVAMTPSEEQAFLDAQKYALTVAEARQKKDKEVKEDGMNLFKGYRDSDLMLSQTTIDAYRASLIADYNAAKTAVLAIDTGTEDGDIAAIEAYQVNWNPPI